MGRRNHAEGLGNVGTNLALAKAVFHATRAGVGEISLGLKGCCKAPSPDMSCYPCLLWPIIEAMSLQLTGKERLIDPFGRKVEYVRVSVTDRCNLRCTYCMSEQMQFLPKADILSLEELERICVAFVRKGVRRLRLTGGEPLVRRGIMTLVRGISQHLGEGGLEELTLTTNGVRLREFARPLADSGVRRVNVSLDSLDRLTFARIARADCLPQVLDGISAAREAGLKVKIQHRGPETRQCGRTATHHQVGA